jgi:hypothetical protein
MIPRLVDIFIAATTPPRGPQDDDSTATRNGHDRPSCPSFSVPQCHVSHRGVTCVLRMAPSAALTTTVTLPPPTALPFAVTYQRPNQRRTRIGSRHT